MFGAHAIEHGSSRTGRWLRQHRMRFTLWLAAAEGLLYIVTLLSFWPLVALAVIFVAVWVWAGRNSRSDTVRQVTWILAVAQLLVLLVPIAWALVKTVAIVMVALLAIAALVFLVTERN
jgi:uncharacterized membrane protein YdbT with pleckstrin-like domain